MISGVFENFRNIYLETYELDPENFFSAPGLAWQVPLKKTNAKLDLLTDIDTLSIMVETGIRGGICHSIYRHAKANSKYLKDYDKNKESSYIHYWDANNLYRWSMSQKLLANNFEWIKDTFQFNEDFIKKYDEESDEEYFLEVDVQYLKKLQEYHNYLTFLSKKHMKIQKFKKHAANLHDKIEYLIQIRNLEQALNHRLVFKSSEVD